MSKILNVSTACSNSKSSSATIFKIQAIVAPPKVQDRICNSHTLFSEAAGPALDHMRTDLSEPQYLNR